MFVDKRFLTDSVIVYPLVNTDDYDRPLYGEPIVLAPVRCELFDEVSGVENKRRQSAVGKIFVCSKYCEVALDKRFLRAKVVFEGGRELQITKIQAFNKLFDQRVFSYEIEVSDGC
jgi:hypothetical protein